MTIFFGAYPSKTKELVDKPEETRAEITEDGPGIGVTFIFFSIAFETNSYPGSEINGVPASEIMANEVPFFNNSKK